MKNIGILLLITVSLFTIDSCKDDDPKPDPVTIAGISPATGPVGTSVTIAGMNFSTTPSDNTVKFNGTEAVVSPATKTQLVVIVPAGATTGNVTVTVDGKTATSALSFTVTNPKPTITGISPATGPVGTSVIIDGTNFSTTLSDNTVKFNGTAAILSSATETQLIVIVPAGATTGTITVTVKGETATGLSFTVTNPKPTITGISPATGPVGTSVIIDGTNFSTTLSDNIVKFNGTAAVVSSATKSQLVVTVPAGATTGTITVTVGGEIATSAQSFTILDGKTFIDSRDGQVYGKVKIGDQVWMSENLNYNPGTTGGLYYDNDSLKNHIYGRLYHWETVMNGANPSTKVPSGVQGLCPQGWHFPSIGEWDALLTYLSDNNFTGRDLMAKTLWNDLNVPTNKTGFSALPSGTMYNGGMTSTNITSQTNFMSSTGQVGFSVSGVQINSNGQYYSSLMGVNNYWSCRCVED